MVREHQSAAEPRASWRRLYSISVTLAPIVPLALLLLAALHSFAPRGHGVVALTQIFAPYLFYALVPLIPLVFAPGRYLFKLAMLSCLLVFCLRFGSSLVSLPASATPNSRQLSALTWNLELTNRQMGTIRDQIVRTSADIVGLQELTYAQAEALASDVELRTRYPYRLLTPRSRARGMGLLSRYPIVEQDQGSETLPQMVRLDLGNDTTLTVINAHPRPARIRLPLFYEPTRRDTQIAAVRKLIDARLAEGESLLVLGDFNITEREPTYRALVAGLQDAHLLVGHGSGNSWRPGLLKPLPLGVLRIDYLLTSSHLRPLRTHTDCTPRGSDHCSIHGEFELQ